MKVSIMMGVYNPADRKAFYRALQSVVRQTFRDWELILYDDGSEEAYAAFIQDAARMDSRIRYLRGGTNRGLAHALNVCIRSAAGEFLARMDADDVCRPERIGTQYEFLLTHPQYDWVGSDAELIDARGVWGYQRMPERPDRRDYLFNLPYIHPSVMFRRETLTENGGYSTSPAVRQCEDYELFLRLEARGLRGYNLQEPLLAYYEDYGSMKKRTYRRRIREMHVRKQGFQALGFKAAEFSGYRILFYVVKPLLVGTVPAPVHHYIKRMRQKPYVHRTVQQRRKQSRDAESWMEDVGKRAVRSRMENVGKREAVSRTEDVGKQEVRSRMENVGKREAVSRTEDVRKRTAAQLRSADPLIRRRWQYRRYLKNCPAMYQEVRQVRIPTGDAAALAASHVFAPVLGSFVQWVLQSAVRDGRRRLYFLARDGYLMYRAAQVICEQQGISIECRYLSCSRYSLRIPMFHLNEADALSYVCRGGIDVTLRKILYRAGLTGEEAEQICKILNLPFAPDAVLPYTSLAQIKKQLAACPEFLERMNQHSREALPLLAGYLRQEGLLDGVLDAVVDSGWTGSMQKTLNEILHVMGRTERLQGYYWGLYELPGMLREEPRDSSPAVQKKEYHCYYFSPDRGLSRKIFFNNCVFEAVFTAPHGMTAGYRYAEPRKETKKNYAEHFAEEHGTHAEEHDIHVEEYSIYAEKHSAVILPRYGHADAAQAEFLRKLEYYMMQYVNIFAKHQVERSEAKQRPKRCDRKVIYRLLRLFMTQPTTEEAFVFGNLPFSDDVLEGHTSPLAAPLSECELRENHALPRLLAQYGISGKTVKESAWYEGSAVLGGRRVRQHLRQYTIYKTLRFLRKRWKMRR